MSGETRTFAEAVAARGGATTANRPPAPQPPPAPVAAASAPKIIDTPVGVVDTYSGEVIDLAAVEHEFLVALTVELRRREAQIKQYREAAEAELVERHGDRKVPQVLGDFEVNVERKWSRDWDADELQGVLDDLVERDLLDSRQASGLVRVIAKVNGTEAQRLLNRLEGEALVAVQDCFVWKEARPKVTVTAIPDLADALPKQLPDAGFEQVDNEGHPDRSR